jgi:hypothetical protein
MTKSTFFKLLFAVMVVIGFTCAPGPAFAQHGGGGGFHGGGGGGGFHGGGGGAGRSNAAAPRGGSFGARSWNSMSAASRGSSAVSTNRALSHIDNSHFGRGGRFRGGFECFGCDFGFGGFGFGGFGFGGFGFGGFGFGPFFDFGWGWPGFYGYDPFWYGSYSGFGYPYYPGYGYPGYSVTNSDPDYSSSNQNLDGGYSFSANNNLGVAAPDTMMNDYSSASIDHNNFEPALQGSNDTTPLAGNVADSAPTALIYLKNGTTYSVTDYWLQGGRLHYTVNHGGPSTLKVKEVDLQRTVDENARRGIRFSLKPHPSSVNSQPSRQNQGSTVPFTTPAPASNRQLQTSSQSQT